MCTYPTAPPALSFYWPWQAPGQALIGHGLFVAMYVVILALNVRTTLARPLPGRQRELAVGFFGASGTLVLAGAVLGSGFVLPSWDALAAWASTQQPWADAHQCAHDLVATVSLMSSSYDTLLYLSFLTIIGGFFLAAVGPVLPPMQRATAWLGRWWGRRRATR